MLRFFFLYGCCACLLCTCVDADSGEETTTQQQTTPNIIFILTDDQGYGDLSGYGSSRVHSPNLDQMATEGIKLTSFYAFPSCTRDRAPSCCPHVLLSIWESRRRPGGQMEASRTP